MDPRELIKTGKLGEARKQLTEELKGSPGDLGRRTLLFQVLSFCGEWDKAERHLETISTQDPTRETGVSVYRDMIRAEKERLDVRRRNRQASFLPEPPPYRKFHDEAWQKLAAGEIAQATELFEEVEAQRPMVSGTVNGQEFTGVSDTDSLLFPFLEAFVHERYVLVPFESIRELVISPPTTLFDLLWVPALVTTWEGLTMNCHLPVLYPESFLHEDDRVKLGRVTDWASLGGGPLAKGMGQHVFRVGNEDIALLEIREALFKRPDGGVSGEKSN
jgi:type VI secretion system protein ImpE